MKTQGTKDESNACLKIFLYFNIDSLLNIRLPLALVIHTLSYLTYGVSP